jgi:uncharacterized membrane protein YhiD involved in acid resistance
MNKKFTERMAKPRLTGMVAALGTLAASGPVWAKDWSKLFDSEKTRSSSFGELSAGWDSFGDGWRMADMAVVLMMAVLLGAAIAYHPTSRRKAATLEELEQPKTFIMYAMVGAVIGVIVSVYPVMGPVIFGIGGLLRFRTDVGPAKDTGRVILAVVVGVAAGLKLMMVAVFATAFGWVIIWVLERQNFARMQVRGLQHELVGKSADVYRKMLLAAGCKMISEKKKFTKGMITFVFTAPMDLDRDGLEERFVEKVPPDIRGYVDWDIA